MNLDFTTPGKLKVDMREYVKSMVEEFPEELKDSMYPWDKELFTVDPKSPALSKDKTETFVTYTYRALFVAQRARMDIAPAVAWFTTRVTKATEQDYQKLILMMRFLKKTQDDVACMEAHDMRIIRWWLDASFAVHPDMRSHTGAVMSLGKGAIIAMSTKQKINTRSSCESELVSFDDIIPKCMWTKLFIEAQGYGVENNLVYRDNQSAMKLELNGKASSGKRTRHFNIKYFFVTDLIGQGQVKTEYCPTDLMIADYMTKPLLGAKFHEFRQAIMNIQK
jgi:hypothetical protein